MDTVPDNITNLVVEANSGQYPNDLLTIIVQQLNTETAKDHKELETRTE